ncbi:MAG TPA: glycosyltransferase, partial [Dehalococcoidia bacterium]|nr:glycosyltransferase [Dehalococcoidia bacterium]
GVDLDRFEPTSRAAARLALGLALDEPIVLFVGRIEPLKGIDLLIDALSYVEPLGTGSPATLLIVGGDALAQREVEDLRHRAARTGVADRVRFVGSAPREMLPLFYSAADVCVVPSHYESFGLVAVEAMACGTPVVASRVGGLTTTVQDGVTGYLVPWRCPEPFAERIELLLANPYLRDSLGRAARRSVERLRWGHIAERVLALYRELAGAVAPGRA